MAKEFEVLYSYQYNDHDKQVIDEALDRMNGKSQDVMSGMPGMWPNTAVKDDMVAFAKKWAPWNPLYADESYAAGSK